MDTHAMHFPAIETLNAAYKEDSSNTLHECRQNYGGKALNLIILHHTGYPVPPYFVIPTSIFEQEMDRALRQFPDLNPREALENYDFGTEFCEALSEAMHHIGASQWAVRSSSTDEDSQHQSLAGMQESVIGVSTLAECLAAIRTVWQSFYARERLLYPSRDALCLPVPAMGTIIQAFVDSEKAGVVFTRHPFEGSASLLINVSRGQGANVVNGKAAESLCISKKTIDSEAGLLIESSCLTNPQIIKLSRLSCAIETYFGKPQDIEFAFIGEKLWILQTRDIVENDAPCESTLYSNVNVGEALSGVATPMTWSVGMSIAQRGFKMLFDTFGLSVPPEYQFVTTFYGHIYINISEAMSAITQIPFIRPDIFGRVLGIRALDEHKCSVKKISRSYFLRHLPLSIAKLLSVQHRLRNLPQQARKFRLERDKLLSRDLSQASPREIRSAFARLNDLFFECTFDMLGAGGTFLGSYLLFSDFIDRFGGETGGELESYLIGGLNDVQSAAPGLEILDIANEIRHHDGLKEAFIETENFGNLEAFKTRIAHLPWGKEFLERFSVFLKRHGSRANQEAELANPRWREDPRFLLRVIRTHLKSGTSQAPQHIVNTASFHRESKTDEFSRMLSLGLRPLFRTLLKMASESGRLREEWRAYIVDVLGLFRKYFIETAQQFVKQGILDKPDDIFFLTYDEFRRGLVHPDELSHARLWTAFRKARHTAYCSMKTLPDTFVTHPNLCDESPHTPLRALRGLPASPGCVRAKVRVVNTLEEAGDLEYGEILAAQTTDVGWTPLFLIAGAILTERGGPLSHAFVVAREYGIPAVVSIPGLLETLHTGDTVTVSGQKGTVYIDG